MKGRLTLRYPVKRAHLSMKSSLDITRISGMLWEFLKRAFHSGSPQDFFSGGLYVGCAEELVGQYQFQSTSRRQRVEDLQEIKPVFHC